MRDCPPEIKEKGGMACQEFERDFMSNCPKKFISNSTMDEQELRESCLRDYYEKKTKKSATNSSNQKKTKKRLPQNCTKCRGKGIDVLRKGHKCPYK